MRHIMRKTLNALDWIETHNAKTHNVLFGRIRFERHTALEKTHKYETHNEKDTFCIGR